jgi:hypothetical protein
MSNKKEAIEPEVVSDDLHDSMENTLYSAVYTLERTVDKLLQPDNTKTVPTTEQVDNAINCVHQIISAAAVFHKGREIRGRNQYLQKQLPAEIEDGIDKLTH